MKTFRLIISTLFLVSMIFFFSCKKNISNSDIAENNNSNSNSGNSDTTHSSVDTDEPVLVKKVSGFIYSGIDMSLTTAAGVNVECAGQSVPISSEGYFEFSNITLTKNCFYKSRPEP